MKREKKAPSAPAFIDTAPSNSTHPITEAEVSPLDTSVVDPASSVKFRVEEVSRSRKILADTSCSAAVVKPIFSYKRVSALREV